MGCRRVRRGICEGRPDRGFFGPFLSETKGSHDYFGQTIRIFGGVRPEYFGQTGSEIGCSSRVFGPIVFLQLGCPSVVFGVVFGHVTRDHMLKTGTADGIESGDC